MTSKGFKIAALLLAVYLIIGGALCVCAADTHAVGDSFLDGIVSYKRSQDGAASTQAWIDGELTRVAGTSAEWYIFALRQSGRYDFSRYAAALQAYDAEHPVASATTRQKHALALYAAGGPDDVIAEWAANTVGGQGIMSYVFGIHLLRNGIPCGASLSQARGTLLSLQLSDGGFAVMGQTGDVDVTAMTLQALAPDYGADAATTAAIDKAIAFLSEKQKAGGQFATYGVDNAESTAQVLLAMAMLGIDASDARFVKDGHTVLDGLALYRLSSGAFCHTAGSGFSELATAQVMDALTAYRRPGSAFYRFPHNPAAVTTASTAPPTTTAATTAARTTARTTAAGSATTVTSTPTAPADASEVSEASEAVGSLEPSEYSEPAAPGTTETWQDPAARTTATTVTAPAVPASSGGYKPIATAVVIGLGLLTAVLLWALKKRHFKNYLAVLIVVCTIIAAIWLTNIQTTDDYYSGAPPASGDAVGTVTISIRCDVLGDALTHSDKAEYLPDDGIILAETEFPITEGETVFDLLDAAARAHRIQVDSRGVQVGTKGSVYVSGIAYLYEFDFGQLSGWMYRVNGDTPSVGCGEYELHPGDRVEWIYTTNMGHDLPES